MNNWWIAVLEFQGILTRDEAEALALQAKEGICPAEYKDAYKQVNYLFKKLEPKSIAPKK